jgi:flagellar biosynthesis protein FliQ
MQRDIRELARGWQPSQVRFCVRQIEVLDSKERHMEEAWAVSGDLQQSGRTYHQGKDCTFHFSMIILFSMLLLGFTFILSVCTQIEEQTCNLFNKMVVICNNIILLQDRFFGFLDCTTEFREWYALWFRVFYMPFGNYTYLRWSIQFASLINCSKIINQTRRAWTCIYL